MGAVKETIGARETFTELYQENIDKVFRYMRYKVNDNQVAEDLTSTVFEKALTNFDKYSSDKASFSTWLFTIARNVVIDHYRVTSRRGTVSLQEATSKPSDDISPEELLEKKEEMGKLHACLEQLSDEEQEIVRLKFGAEYNNRQIAKMVGLSETNVGTKLYRAVKKLRGSFQEAGVG